MQPSIYEFDTFGAFFREYVAWLKTKRQSFSYRQLASKIGDCTHNILVMIAQGKRVPSADLLSRICQYMKCNDEEKAFAEAMVGMERASNANERQYYGEKMTGLRPHKYSDSIEYGEYIADWVYVTIYEMSQLGDFKNSNDWFFDRLGGKVSRAKIHQAIQFLKTIGYFEEHEGWLIPKKKRLMSNAIIATEFKHAYYRQHIDLALEALPREPFSQRYFAGASICIDDEKLQDAKDFVSECQAKFIEMFSSKNPLENRSANVYHLGMQLFSLTQRLKKPSEDSESES